MKITSYLIFASALTLASCGGEKKESLFDKMIKEGGKRAKEVSSEPQNVKITDIFNPDNKYERNEYSGRTQFAEIFASIKMGHNFTLLQGGDFRHGNMSNDYYSISSFGPYSSSFKDTAMSQTSLYSSLLFNSNNKKLNIELGGRLNTHSRYGSNYTYTFNPSYNINIKYRVFGSIASGFKAPSLYQLYAGGGTGNPNLLAEKSVNYELGVQQQLKKVSNRIVLFNRNIKDGIETSSILLRKAK